MEKETATKLINLLFVKSDKYSHYTSHYLKHIIEISASILKLPNAYLSNDNFKELMIELGFENKKKNEDDDIYKLEIVNKYNSYSKISKIQYKIENLLKEFNEYKERDINNISIIKLNQIYNKLNKIELFNYLNYLNYYVVSYCGLSLFKLKRTTLSGF